jgi:UDP-N-acetyl-D-glucosamine/UDP-N-acetyl-D-galactosamine dehydrogenase
METKICVIGLGYVGLPLALAFSKMFKTIGFDIDHKKVNNLVNDSNKLSKTEKEDSNIEFTTVPNKISECNFIIIAVPTPIDEGLKPDLSCIKESTKIVGNNISKGSIVVYESTVYPGVTEEICIPLLEQISGLKCGTDFKVGYSPERINPGDKEHTVNNTIKIVSAIDEESLNIISNVYNKIVKKELFKAKNIKTAEAAKVIENIQRDLNIALVNELSLIFDNLGINTMDVLKAAGTKWNFHKYHPGLVGGHCIGVDPYYLAYKAQQQGFYPKVILAGRDTNEYMAKHVANLVLRSLNNAGKVLKGSSVLILGLTFKENISDIRNSKAKDIIKYLKEFGINVTAYDPFVNEDAQSIFNVNLVNFNDVDKIDAVILVTPHNEFKNITLDDLQKKMDLPVLVDVKSFYNCDEAVAKGFVYKCL